MEPGSSRQSQDEADGVTPAGFFCGGRGYQRRRRTRTTASSLGKLGLAYPVVGLSVLSAHVPLKDSGGEFQLNLAGPIGVKSLCDENADADEYED